MRTRRRNPLPLGRQRQQGNVDTRSGVNCTTHKSRGLESQSASATVMVGGWNLIRRQKAKKQAAKERRIAMALQ